MNLRSWYRVSWLKHLLWNHVGVVDEWLEVIKEWNLHWAIREFCKSWLNRWLTHPAASVVYPWWDYQDGI